MVLLHARVRRLLGGARSAGRAAVVDTLRDRLLVRKLAENEGVPRVVLPRELEQIGQHEKERTW